MRVVMIILLCYSYSVIVAQRDTVWQLANRVYIKAPKKVDIYTRYSCGPGCRGPKEGADLVSNFLNWETEACEFRVSVVYNDKSLRLLKRARDLEKLPWLSEGLQCEIMGTEMKRSDQRDLVYSDVRNAARYSLTKFEKINGKYYYLDEAFNEWYIGGKTFHQHIREHERAYDEGKVRKKQPEGERTVRSFLGIPYYYYDNRNSYKAEFKRSILVDSVLYTFSMVAKEHVYMRKGAEKNNKKRILQAFEKHKVHFYNFVNNIIIKEEDGVQQK